MLYCSSWGYPHPDLGPDLEREGWRVLPSQVRRRRGPHPAEGVPHFRSEWGVPHPVDRGYPIPDQTGATPVSRMRVTSQSAGWEYPHWDWMGVPHHKEKVTLCKQGYM